MDDKTKKAKKFTAKTALKILVNIVVYLFLALAIFSVIVTIVGKKRDGATDVFGYQMRIVTSSSMEECELTDVSQYKIKDIPIESMIFIQTVPDDPAKADEWFSKLKVGDVLTFKYAYNSHVTITHRIISIEPNEQIGGYTIELQGDNKDGTDDKNRYSGEMVQTIYTAERDRSTDFVIGKVTAKSTVLGKIITFLQKPVGLVLLVILPAFIIIVYEVIRLVGAFGSSRKKKELEEQAKKDSELEELRRKLEALEHKQDEAAAEKTDAPADEKDAEAPPAEDTAEEAEVTEATEDTEATEETPKEKEE